jgi:DNA mismatch repair protein MutS
LGRLKDMAQKNSTTPMMEQYFRIKDQHKDALLFFRLGDFYEMFYEDAKTASPVLEIALTSRQKVPMCGVPYHAAQTYLPKLLKRGFKVAICEQVEDPRQSKGVVKREVVKILTPGTAVELDLSDSKENNFVASICLRDSSWGMAVVDMASGEMQAMESDGGQGKKLSDELFRVYPREVIYPESQEGEVLRILGLHDMSGVHVSSREDWIFDLSQAVNFLMNHFQVQSLAGFGLEEKNLAVAASGALLDYLKTLRKDSLSVIHHLSYIQSHSYMTLDAASIKNLELLRNLRDGRVKGSFLDIIDFTSTPMGGRLLRSWLLHPLMDVEEIRLRAEAVTDFLEHTIDRQGLRDVLKSILDLQRLTSKVSMGVAHARDLVALKKSLQPLPDIRTRLKAFGASLLKGMRKQWDSAEDLCRIIEEAIKEEPSFLLTEGGIIAEGFNTELDELRVISRSGKTFIARMEKKERQRTGISSLKIRYNKVFGYYIDVTKPNLPLVPEDYIRKQTLVNSERFITPELKEYEEKVLNAEQRIAELEYNLFLEVREKIASHGTRLHMIASNIARLDVLTGLAELAAQRGYSPPEVNMGPSIRIREGRHPVIECLNSEPFIPNDTYLDRSEDQILIVTGPNMGGKSTYLRQVALITILAQMGAYVPAEEAEIGVVDRIFTRIGAMDFLSVGQSTFMVEMLETANILNNATEKSLILLDEIGRGTSTFDGLSIAWAVAEYLHEEKRVRAKTLFATHYHELTELSITMERIKNYHVSVKEWQDDIIFLRKIVSGPSDQSYGIHVAKLAGIPKEVILRAREILFNLEKKELDASGVPRIAYKSTKKTDKSQILLFPEDRQSEVFSEIRIILDELDISRLTPLDALNLLHNLKERLRQ